jgi:UDP-N-acetylglucosamine:LPS N-acetylglucosamine transferase
MQSTRTPTVVVISAGIGAGHDGAAAEISRQLRASGIAIERHDYLDLLPPGWGKIIKQTYARQLAYAPASWGRLLSAAGRPAATRSAAWLSAHAASDHLLAAIPLHATAVISTYPLASQALGQLGLAMPTVAVLTDPSVHPLCAAPGVDLHLAPNEDTAGQVRDRFGLPATAVAPIVDPAFRPATGPADVRTARHRHGLPPHAPIALIVAGSWGVGDIEATVRDVTAATVAVPVVACGRNTALRDRLAATGTTIPLGWVDDMPALLRAADVVVHNAGGLTSMEALASGVPVISYRCLPGHGVANAAVLERIGLSAWPRALPALASALRAAFDGRLRQTQRPAFHALTQAGVAADLIHAVARIPAVLR